MVCWLQQAAASSGAQACPSHSCCVLSQVQAALMRRCSLLCRTALYHVAVLYHSVFAIVRSYLCLVVLSCAMPACCVMPCLCRCTTRCWPGHLLCQAAPCPCPWALPSPTCACRTSASCRHHSPLLTPQSRWDSGLCFCNNSRGRSSPSGQHRNGLLSILAVIIPWAHTLCLCAY